MTTAIVAVICVFFGATCGLLLGGIAAAAARADEIDAIHRAYWRMYHVSLRHAAEDGSPPAG